MITPVFDTEPWVAEESPMPPWPPLLATS